MSEQATAAADDAARRQYWTDALERSVFLMDTTIAGRIEECGEPLASIPDAAAAAGIEMQFSETLIGGQFERIFHIRESLVNDIVTIGREMNERGWIMRIEDGFRTRAMQTALGRNPAIFDGIVEKCRWESGGAKPTAELVFRRAKCLVAIWPRTGTHLLGAAVDISVFRRDDGSEVWRGGPYIEMSERTPMASPWVTAEEHANRMEITEHMERHGFMHYPGEFWHYNKGDALYQYLIKSGKPGIYGPVDWDPATGATTPWTDIDVPLTPPDVFTELVEAALARLDDE